MGLRNVTVRQEALSTDGGRAAVIALESDEQVVDVMFKDRLAIFTIVKDPRLAPTITAYLGDPRGEDFDRVGY